MENVPKYPLQSVDRALELALLLKHRQRIGVSEAARELGVAKSTAHRLLVMLVRHGFAVHDPAHGYRVGDVLLGTEKKSCSDRLTRFLHPYLDTLVRVTGETANLQVLRGALVKIVDCVQGTAVLCIGDRRGVRLRAESSSGGLALLSLLGHEEVMARYRDDTEIQLPGLFAALSRARREGYALNVGQSEPHIRAVAAPVRDRAGVGVAALAVAVPAVRFDVRCREQLAGVLLRTAQRAQRDLASLDPAVLHSADCDEFKHVPMRRDRVEGDSMTRRPKRPETSSASSSNARGDRSSIPA